LKAALQVLTTDAARAWEPSWLLWKHFDDNWEYLSTDAREHVRVAAEREFGRSEHWMWSFMIGVLFAECFTDGGALDALERFVESSDDQARAVLPDALRNLARRTTDTRLKARARARVQSLENDRSPHVRAEARAALARWK